jgi:hypothetical protein
MSSVPLDEVEVERFWEWFAAVADDIGADIQANKRTIRHVREMQRQVAVLHPQLRWEIGPHGARDLFLAISPAGDPDLLAYTKAVTSRAPALRGWHFLAAKPRKDWLRRELILQDRHGFRKVVFDGWRFRVRQERGIVCIDFDPGPNPDFTEIETENLMWLYVESELGEEAVMRHAPVLTRTELTGPGSLSPEELRARFDRV